MKPGHLNVIFVYSMLVVDLLINITDNLVPSTIESNHTGESEINSTALMIFFFQISAIVCVVTDLVMHFMAASDEIIQSVWLKSREQKIIEGYRSKDSLEPVPQRVALRLVLEKFWWSLVVGLTYLVVTIILQSVRLDPGWHAESSKIDSFSVLSAEKSIGLVDSKAWPPHGDSNMDSSKLNVEGGVYTDQKFVQKSSSITWLKIIVLLIHKSMSTCYYVSFVVVYRLSPEQIKNRILTQRCPGQVF